MHNLHCVSKLLGATGRSPHRHSSGSTFDYSTYIFRVPSVCIVQAFFDV